MRTFLEFYDGMRESSDVFYVGKIPVRLTEVSDDAYSLFAEAGNTIPNPKSLQPHPWQGQIVGLEPRTKPEPTNMKKWRVTYTINGKEITNYLTAQNKVEAKRMLFDYLQNLGNDRDRLDVVRSSDIAPVNNWNELVRLLQYSMQYDRKTGGDSFGSLDTADFHLLLDLVNKHPQFVERQLATLPQDLQYYFKRVYNALSRRDLGKEGSYWRDKVKSLTSTFGDNIRRKLAAVKTRNSPRSAEQIAHDRIDATPDDPHAVPRAFGMDPNMPFDPAAFRYEPRRDTRIA